MREDIKKLLPFEEQPYIPYRKVRNHTDEARAGGTGLSIPYRKVRNEAKLAKVLRIEAFNPL